MYLGALVGTVGRFKDADFSSPWMSSAFSILIPIPNSSTNIGALIEPMSTEVFQTYISPYKVIFLDERCYFNSGIKQNHFFISGVDLHKSINTDRHAKSLWFEPMYYRPE